MKPLSIKEQIRILKKVLYSPFIYGMCILIAKYSGNNFMDMNFSPEKLIPSFNHLAYLRFYPKCKAVQKRQYKLYWDSSTIFGNLRRRWFIRHLIKELEKQL
jgi:hypothetical protein